MNKHKGEIVENIVRKSGFSLKKLAERMKISRNTLYNRFRDPELGYEFIVDVGRIIHYNFSIDFPELDNEVNELGEPWIQYGDKDAVELLKREKKYTALLERYNQLLSMLVKLANANELETLRKEILRFLEDNPN